MINIICVGKIKERYLQEGINEYLKRLKPFYVIQITEIKEITTNDISKNIIEEEKLILSKIKNNDYVITLEIEGNNLSSEELSKHLNSLLTYHNSDIVFVIGGSYGLGENIKKRSNFALSLGKNTYPHQLVRLIFLEQLYRSFMIIHNTKYHK